MTALRLLVRPEKISLALLVIAAALLPACSSFKAKSAAAQQNNGKFYSVTADKTAFYRYGPQQGNGPDESLPRDTLMTLIRPSFGYCKVHLVATSKDGYVASEDIKPAPPTLVAALTAPTPSPISVRETFDVQSNTPPPPETLPAPDLPPATTEPSPQ